MKKMRLLWVLLSLFLLLSGCFESTESDKSEEPKRSVEAIETLNEDGEYITKEEIKAYLVTYRKLPSNFIAKAEAKKLGWDHKKGNLAEVAPGKSIGGDVFGNREKKLPTKPGRIYYECDVGYRKGFRNGERIVYSNDGLIFFTKDHYQNFEQLYPEE